MKKTKKIVKQNSRTSKTEMSTWAKAVNWAVLATCLAFGLLMMFLALSGLNEASMFDSSVAKDSTNVWLSIIAFLFATMGMSFYACVKLYNKNITGYISFFLTLLFFAIYIGMIGSSQTSLNLAGTGISPLGISFPTFYIYFFTVPALLVFFAFILMLKYLKPFTKQDIVLIAIYILFFLFLAPSSLFAAIDFAEKKLNLK